MWLCYCYIWFCLNGAALTSFSLGKLGQEAWRGFIDHANLWNVHKDFLVFTTLLSIFFLKFFDTWKGLEVLLYLNLSTVLMVKILGYIYQCTFRAHLTVRIWIAQNLLVGSSYHPCDIISNWWDLSSTKCILELWSHERKIWIWTRILCHHSERFGDLDF